MGNRQFAMDNRQFAMDNNVFPTTMTFKNLSNKKKLYNDASNYKSHTHTNRSYQ